MQPHELDSRIIALLREIAPQTLDAGRMAARLKEPAHAVGASLRRLKAGGHAIPIEVTAAGGKPVTQYRPGPGIPDEFRPLKVRPFGARTVPRETQRHPETKVADLPKPAPVRPVVHAQSDIATEAQKPHSGPNKCLSGQIREAMSRDSGREWAAIDIAAATGMSMADASKALAGMFLRGQLSRSKGPNPLIGPGCRPTCWHYRARDDDRARLLDALGELKRIVAKIEAEIAGLAKGA